jgi:16S rRNA (uracil1498-N3)-methyltransferase
MGQQQSKRDGRPPAPAPAGRYDAPGDPLIVIPLRLSLGETFRFGRGIAARLGRREVNVKEAFTVRDDTGQFFRVSLKSKQSDGGEAVAYERMARSPEPTIDLTLACAVLARQRMIYVMQKATELGVSRVVPLLTDHSVPRSGLEHERANAWPAQVVRAAKQCRRSSLPAVMPPTTLDDFLASADCRDADERVVLDDRESARPAAASAPRRIVLFVGPEGGFSDAERERLAAAARPWFLGGRILRAETAVLAGLTAVHMRWGDFAD